MRRREAAHLGAVLGTTAHYVHGDHTVLDDAGLAVDILQEAIQGLKALGEAGLELAPVATGHCPGQAVDGDDVLVGLAVAVNREGDALVRKRAHHTIMDVAQVCAGEPEQGLLELAAMLPGSSVRQEHLVIDRRVEIVTVEIHACNLSSPRVAEIMKGLGGPSSRAPVSGHLPAF